MTGRFFAVLAALLAAAGVALGAYHAHGLEKWLTRSGAEPAAVQHRLDNADVAVRYQMYHATALLALGIVLASHPRRLLTVACALLTVGVCLFSGGLYLIVFLGTALHWAIVPLGGVTLIAGWIVAAVALARLQFDT